MKNKEYNGGQQGLGEGGGRVEMQPVDKQSWRSNVWYSDYSQEYCIINFKVAMRLYVNYSHHTHKKR